MTVADLKSFLTRPYQREGWLQTLRGVLPQTEIFSLPQPLASADDRAESVFQLGRVQLQGDRQLGILEVRVGEATDLARNRVGLRNLVTRFIDQAEYHGMLSVFLTPRPDYRFTFAARESAFDTEGNLVRNETAPRRYTYLLGPGESCRIAPEDKALPPVLNRLTSAKRAFYDARGLPEKRRLQFEILDATAELAKLEFGRSKLDISNSLITTDDDADKDRVLHLDHAIREMNAFRAQLEAARKLKTTAAKDEALEKLSGYFADEAKPSFVWQIDFAEVFHRPPKMTPGRDLLDTTAIQTQGGFDLMLANPPYVRQEKLKDLKPLLENACDCYTGVADLYVYFFERGVKLLRDGGVLSYISSNSFLNSAFGTKLRRFLKAQVSVRALIDFAETKVFTAITEPCILIAANRPKSQQPIAAVKWDQSQKPENVDLVVRQRAVDIQQSQLEDDGWRLESPAVLALLDKMRRGGKPLGDLVNGRFYYGIKTGLNEAFVVDRTTRDKLIVAHKSSAEVLKPYLRGRDIRRWCVVDPELWLIALTKEEIKMVKEATNSHPSRPTAANDTE